MKYSFKAWFYGHFFHSTCKPQYKNRNISNKAMRNIVKEHKAITLRAKDMNDEKLLSSCEYFTVKALDIESRTQLEATEKSFVIL